jgi:NitT/TauT family transport system ATP-binding protein
MTSTAGVVERPGGVAPAARADTTPAIRIEGVSKTYGHSGNALVALDRMSLDVAPGEFVCLVGASGCGKSTLLNIVAGLDSPTQGRVDVNLGRPALMFQESALFPWLTVRRNIELALRLSKVPRSERRSQADTLLEMVHLGGFGDKKPHELSGGMRQRGALARALAQRASVLLMDEPFGALDAMTRDILHDELDRLWRENNLSVLFVTHNVREAVRLGDRVVLLSSRPGRVVAEFDVDIDRPRRIDSTEIANAAATITDRLREEVRRHAD